MDRPILAVVMAGGTGTRLYPASRSDRPKQLLSLGGDRSLLERTLDRAAFADRRVVLAGEDLASRIREHVDEPVWVEPQPKDTGPALAYAAWRARETLEDEPVLVCLPSDHHVEGAFAPVAELAARVAVETRGLVTLGIEPDRPATGYGYVRPGREEDGYAPVERFHEKPDQQRATRLVEEGALWNAGIFAWTPSALLSAAKDSPLAGLVEALEEGDPRRGFDAVEPVSVDYAVLERTDHAFVVPADLEWDDLGTWDALGRILESDPDGNAVLGDALTVDATENVLASDGHVTAVGVEELVVAAFDDRVLVVPRDQTQRVREAVEELRSGDRF